MTSRKRKSTEPEEVWKLLKLKCGKIVSVPKSWTQEAEREIKSGEKCIETRCFWPKKYKETKIISMALNQEKHKSSWSLVKVTVIGQAKTLTELNVKERMAKAGVKDIDAAYEKEQEEESDKEKEQSDKEQEDSDKENGPSKKKRKRTPKNFGTDFVTGQGLSSPAEDQVTDASTDEEMQETDKQSNTGLQTPETSPFQNNVANPVNAVKLSEPQPSSRSQIDDLGQNSFQKNDHLKDAMKANDTVNTSETQSSQSSGFKNLEENELKEGNSKLQIEEVNDPSNSQLEKKSIDAGTSEVAELKDNQRASNSSPANTYNHNTTWQVVKPLETGKWHVLPSPWINYDDMECFYPPANAEKIRELYIKPRAQPDEYWQIWKIVDLKDEIADYKSAKAIARAANADDAEDDALFLENIIPDEHDAEEIKTVKKSTPRIKSNVSLGHGRPRPLIRKSSTVTKAEFERMSETEQRYLIYCQNEEIIRLNNKLFVELQSSKSSTGTSSKTNALVSHLFPIKTLATLLEIETQLEEEDDKLKRKQSLPKDNLSDAVTTFFENQGGETGHAAFVNMLRHSVADVIQVQYTWTGETKLPGVEKLAFKDLHLYRLMKNVAVEKYTDYTEEKAKESCQKWLKAASTRLKTDKTNGKSKSRNKQLKKMAAKEAAASTNEEEE